MRVLAGQPLPGLPRRPRDLFSVPATLWFAALEHGLNRGDLDAAARAHAELRRLGVTVRITSVGAGPRASEHKGNRHE